jgi:ABC-type molybdate transport system substrate-binding protein
MRSLRIFAACIALALGVSNGQARAADPIRIYAAGSLGAVMPKLIAASGLPEGAVAPPVFGPAGLLRQRLLSGETADLFASADLAQPQAVAAVKPALAVPFARNRMCLLARQSSGVTADNMLDRILSPDLRLAASTPGADPGGDYARAVFAKADKLRPGAEQTLIAKTKLLLGGPTSMTPQPGHSAAATIFLTDSADTILYYCSGAEAAAKEVPGLVSLPVPDNLEVGPVYGLAVMSERPEAARLALFMLSETGQAILKAGGLLPIVSASP